MKIRIICVGKLKEKYLNAGVEEYLKRLQGYCKVEVYEVADESIPDNCSLANEIIIKSKEGRKILDKIKQDDYVILLDVAGKVIGGSLGHGQELIDRANLRLSFSNMTFPHQLMRLILVEQIYRSFKIIKNETYHK